MKTKQYFKLIEGTLSPKEAKIMLNDLLISKIKFHNTQSLRIQIKASGDISNSTKRIKELKAVREKINALIDYASQNNYDLDVLGEIQINLLNK